MSVEVISKTVEKVALDDKLTCDWMSVEYWDKGRKPPARLR